MRRPERGASYVPLIIVIVLLVVAVVWAYTKHDEANKLKMDIIAAKQTQGAEQKSRIETLTYLKNLSEKIGFTLENPTTEKQGADVQKIKTWIEAKIENLRSKYVREFPVAVYSFDANGGVKRSEPVDGKVKVGYIALGAIVSEATLEMLYDQMDGALSRMLNDITRLVGDLQTAQRKFDAREVEFRATVADKDNEVRRLNAANDAIEAAKAQEARDKDNEIQRLKNDVRAAEEQLAAAEEAARAQVAGLNNQILALKQDVVKAKRVAGIIATPGPDGQILAVTDDQGLAVLNRGKAHHLPPNTTFDVFAYGKGAQKIMKGTVTVLDVDGDTSKARIIELINPMNPIVEGDYFESSTYNPDQVLHFYILGRTQKYGKSDASARLRQLGQIVDETVGIETNYLVFGSPESPDDNLRDTEAYKHAQELGIKVITEEQLSKFLNY